jgi:hypothetical protein
MGNLDEYMNKFDHLYTDETGDVHPCYVADTMEGKHGYTGIVYLNYGKEVFEFVENDKVRYMK